MDPLHRISSTEGQGPGQHLVERDAQRVEIAAGIDRAVHSAGLFRRHVRERPGHHFGCFRGLTLAGHMGGNAESSEPDATTRNIHEDIRGLDVFVDETSLMYSAQRTHERDRDA